jgi:hypothetical protein
MPEQVHTWDLDIAQISFYKGSRFNLEHIKACVLACRKEGLSYVIHPVGYRITDTEMFNEINSVSAWADEALILHDERAADDRRLAGTDGQEFRKALNALTSRLHVSFENATHTKDIVWFWQHYADSVTIDLGHVESSGLDSIEFVKNLDREIVDKTEYIHMHRNGDFRNGLTDHWYLTPDCRELSALKEFINLKPDVSVILEINEIEMIEESLLLLREMRI